MNIPEIVELLIREYAGATNRRGRFQSKHEGIAVIREEYLELEEEVFKKFSSVEQMQHEAIQIGAMTMRFIYDVCQSPSGVEEKRMKLGKAILTQMNPVIKGGKFVEEADIFEVRVMAIAEGYAMVRRKGAMPFVCNVKELALERTKEA